MTKHPVFPFFVFCVAISAALPAQQQGTGEIVYAEGKDFVLIRGGERSIHQVDSPDSIGLEIREGDMLQTSSRTFLEVQLLPHGTVLKIAENSSFVFKGFGADGGAVSLSLIYGRVRAKVAKLSGHDTFIVRSGATVAGVRGTDFGVDSIASASSLASSSGVVLPPVRVYCFSGEVAVLPVSEDGVFAAGGVFAADTPVVTVGRDQVVSVESVGKTPLVERAQLDAETIKYWKQNDFKGETPVAAPQSLPLTDEKVAEAPRMETVIKYIPPDYKPYVAANRAKNSAVGAAIVFTVLGLALQSVGIVASEYGDTETGRNLMFSGGIPIGFGVVALVSALSVHPPSP